jgi:hypothetical protein
MCCKKIRTNLDGEKPDYLCSTHSKKHIPKKRIKKNSCSNTTIKNNLCDYKKIKKNRKKKSKKIILCNAGSLNLGMVLSKILNQ